VKERRTVRRKGGLCGGKEDCAEERRTVRRKGGYRRTICSIQKFIHSKGEINMKKGFSKIALTAAAFALAATAVLSASAGTNESENFKHYG
jgi:hypothetical protein